MTAAQSAGRALLAGVFVHGGWCTLREPAPRVHAAGPLLTWLREQIPGLPPDQAVVKANAAVHVTAGLLLAAGVFDRPAAAVLALSLIPTTAAGHPFWAISDPAQRDGEIIQFGKNLGIFGGLLLLACRRPGTGPR
jgi:putative oxidoreductase